MKWSNAVNAKNGFMLIVLAISHKIEKTNLFVQHAEKGIKGTVSNFLNANDFLYRIYASYETYQFLPFSFSPLGLYVKRVF
jgi:hypothetical protein